MYFSPFYSMRYHHYNQCQFVHVLIQHCPASCDSHTILFPSGKSCVVTHLYNFPSTTSIYLLVLCVWLLDMVAGWLLTWNNLQCGSIWVWQLWWTNGGHIKTNDQSLRYVTNWTIPHQGCCKHIWLIISYCILPKTITWSSHDRQGVSKQVSWRNQPTCSEIQCIRPIICLSTTTGRIA